VRDAEAENRSHGFVLRGASIIPPPRNVKCPRCERENEAGANRAGGARGDCTAEAAVRYPFVDRSGLPSTFFMKNR